MSRFLNNARRDNLEKFWNEQFGHHHAVMVVESFYENVQLHVKERRELAAGETEQNIVLEFTPNPPQPMLIACLWSHWTDPHEPDLCGFAAITDEPPPDVAAARASTFHAEISFLIQANSRTHRLITGTRSRRTPSREKRITGCRSRCAV